MPKFRFLVPLVAIALLSLLSIPAGGTIDSADWKSPTPGGNEIGECEGCEGKGVRIFQGTHVYVEEIREFGFYDRAIIGRTKTGYFAFDEQTQDVVEFDDRDRLCTRVQAANRKWNNTLRYFNSSQPIDYYAIKYSLYVLFPFIVLFIGFYLRFKTNLPFPRRIDRILQSKRFAASLLVLTAFSKYWVSASTLEASQSWDRIEDLFFDLLGIFVFAIAWSMGWLCFPKINLRIEKFPGLSSLATSVLKVLLYVGILTIGLSVTLGLIQSSDTSIRFFSCENHL
ncbi:MAG: hypothetical protein D6728_04775 [Cyanobacteria bacterium J055]|nr:MAG: hypothetical protein D6728_04775 [Cyanobacteria bacterium J055]